VRRGKGGRRREIGMDAWGWEQLQPWLAARIELPPGPLFCIIDGPTRGRFWSSAGVRAELPRLAAQAGVRRRFTPHQLRHAHAVELARERAAQRHPAPARARQPRHHQHLPAGHRHRGDHRHRARPQGADDVRHRRTPALTNERQRRERRRCSRHPLPPTTASQSQGESHDGSPRIVGHASCSSEAGATMPLAVTPVSPWANQKRGRAPAGTAAAVTRENSARRPATLAL
jgi:integrase-like protein